MLDVCLLSNVFRPRKSHLCLRSNSYTWGAIEVFIWIVKSWFCFEEDLPSYSPSSVKSSLSGSSRITSEVEIPPTLFCSSYSSTRSSLIRPGLVRIVFFVSYKFASKLYYSLEIRREGGSNRRSRADLMKEASEKGSGMSRKVWTGSTIASSWGDKMGWYFLDRWDQIVIVPIREEGIFFQSYQRSGCEFTIRYHPEIRIELCKKLMVYLYRVIKKST